MFTYFIYLFIHSLFARYVYIVYFINFLLIILFVCLFIYLVI
jgi:hypothetical protein